MSSPRLKGKTALVIGAGCVSPKEMGIGKACSLRFSQESASVFAVDVNAEALRETEREIQENGGAVASFQANVADAADMERMVAACIAQFGRIDVLLYNVAVGEVGGPPELSLESWDRTFAINCTGLFLATKHALPHMINNGGGSIIGVSSIAGLRYVGYPHFAYATTKAAMIQFIRYLGVHYATSGIRANSIIPGLIDTPRVSRLSAAYGEADRAKMKRMRAAQVPNGESGSPWDIAEAALYLAGDESRYTTATEILVDGGLTAQYGTIKRD